MEFEILGDIVEIETIAKGASVRVRGWLDKEFGKGRWRKMKGLAWVRFKGGAVVYAEVHWYEANGVGRRNFKVKRVME